MKKGTKFALFAAAAAGIALVGSKLARLVSQQNQELNDMIHQDPAVQPAHQACSCQDDDEEGYTQAAPPSPEDVSDDYASQILGEEDEEVTPALDEDEPLY